MSAGADKDIHYESKEFAGYFGSTVVLPSNLGSRLHSSAATIDTQCRELAPIQKLVLRWHFEVG